MWLVVTVKGGLGGLWVSWKIFEVRKTLVTCVSLDEPTAVVLFPQVFY